MGLRDWLFGRFLTSPGGGTPAPVGVAAGIPMLGLDGSASWPPTAGGGPHAPCPLSLAGVWYIGPITLLIVAVLLIVYFSYRQAIAAYPQGGLLHRRQGEPGHRRGLLAAAAYGFTGMSGARQRLRDAAG